MRGSQKSKRVSWASDVNLCQVRLFLSEECPSQVGVGVQDHLQAKTSLPLDSVGMGFDDNLPPGFEGTQPAILLKNKLSQIPLLKWRCPPVFVLDSELRVAAAQESKEVEVQNQREMRMLEAVYPRPSSIPPNPVFSGLEDYSFDDQNTPLIPVTPIEDEEAAADTSFNSMPPNTVPMSSQHEPMTTETSASQCRASTDPKHSSCGSSLAPGSTLGVEPDVAAAAYAALNTVMSNSDQGNLINHDFLVKILRDPKLIENLVTSHGASTNSQVIPTPRSQGITSSDPPPIHISRTEVVSRPSPAGPSRPFYPPPNSIGPVPESRPPPPEVILPPPPTTGPPVTKDSNYYKNLIQQHGGERQEARPQFSSRNNGYLGANPKSVNIPKPRDSKPKIMKPCIYFNSSRGCRHGTNCAYLHDGSSQQRTNGMVEVQSSKRMKMDWEITGT